MRIEKAEGHLDAPVMISPLRDQERSFGQLNSWIHQNQMRLFNELQTHGALLFRGFEISDLNLAMNSLGIFPMHYVGGNNPRSAVADRVYLSTDYPKEWKITLHSEMSHLPFPPRFIGFLSVLPSQLNDGGQTMVCSNSRLLQSIPEPILSRFVSKRVSYRQRMNRKAQRFSFGRSWEDVFGTSEMAEVESFCRSHGIEFSWEDEVLITRFNTPAFSNHPETGQPLWFNQAEQWHHTNIDPSVRSFILEKVGLSNLPHHSTFGNGEEFTVEDLEAIRSAYDREAYLHQWQKSDFLILDNFAVSHGRMPFRGPRILHVAMGNKVDQA